MSTASIAPLPGPHGLYNVSVMPHFLLDSSRVGWQGAYFADIVGAPSGEVDHEHRHYCVQRTMHREKRQVLRNGTGADWQEYPVGFMVWQPGEEQRFRWRNSGQSQFLFLAPERMATLVGDTLPSRVQRGPAPSRLLDLLFDALQTDLSQNSPAGPMVGEGLIAAIAAHLRPARGDDTATMTREGRHRVVDLLEARFTESLSLQSLADAAGLGIRQFSRAFRDATGTSPHQYLLRRRAEHAKLLITQGVPLSDVALQCGFSDQSQLNRTFLRHVGTTPGRFRAQLMRRSASLC